MQHPLNQNSAARALLDSRTELERASIIDSLKTEKGGWTRESLASLGVPWPPPKGWRQQLILEGRLK